MSRFANLADKPKATGPSPAARDAADLERDSDLSISSSPPPSRVGRKAIAGYFSPEMSLAMHVCARRHGLSLQELMAEAFDDILRKYGESPLGNDRR